MNPSDLFETWAPTGGPWSAWVKPVLFARLAKPLQGAKAAIPRGHSHVTAAAAGTAFVVDLPGVESIEAGLKLAQLGFRPVPLFNGCPSDLDLLGRPYDEAVPTAPLISALIDGADRLMSADLPLDAPPAFLIDANRLTAVQPLLPNVFDNRWMVFTTDFPSPRTLIERGITNVHILHDGTLRDDLVAVLRLWQRGGLGLSQIHVESLNEPRPLELPSAWWSTLSTAGRRLWLRLTLKPHRSGGFGGFVMDASSSAG